MSPAVTNRRRPVRNELTAVESSSLLSSPPPVCQAIVKALPATVSGMDRLQYIAKALNGLDGSVRTPMRLFVEQFARHMNARGASDMDAGGPASNGLIWYRINGVKKPCANLGSIDIRQMDVLIMNLLSPYQLNKLLEEYGVDFSFEIQPDAAHRPLRFRGSAYVDGENLAISVRAIQSELRSLSSLGFHSTIAQRLLFSNVRDGLTLITGVTGSGKSTTLDAIIEANNRSVDGHIVVIGDPIEYVHDSKRCIIRHREVGKGVASFKAGITQALRQDPDMIVIGEMRDNATVSATLEVTDSGHRVFSTLHTRSAVESIERIIAEYPTEEQARVRNRLADVLRCVVSQKLCPKVGGGLVLAKEVLWMTPSTTAAIKNGNTNEIYQMIWEGSNAGMITLEQDLVILMRKGLITPDTALRYSNNKKRLHQLIGRG